MKIFARGILVVMFFAGIGLTVASSVSAAVTCCSGDRQSCCTGACCMSDATWCGAYSCSV
jgi:hypothetical protein